MVAVQVRASVPGKGPEFLSSRVTERQDTRCDLFPDELGGGPLANLGPLSARVSYSYCSNDFCPTSQYRGPQGDV